VKRVPDPRRRPTFDMPKVSNVVTLNHDRLVLSHARGHSKTKPCRVIQVETGLFHVILWIDQSFSNGRLCTKSIAHHGTASHPPNSRHVRAIPRPLGRWRAARRIETGNAGRLHSREHARGHAQPSCRRGEIVGRGKGCRCRHRSGGGPPASRDGHRRGRHSAAERTCARRAGRPTRRTGGRVGLIAARRVASNRAARGRQQPPTRRCNRRRRAGTITRESSWSR